jgi:hypothetical protein
VWGFEALVINKAPLTLTSDDFNFSATTTSVTYDGVAHAPIITAKDAGLTVSIAYCDWNNGQTWSSSPPINAGTYIVVAYASDRNYQSGAVWGFGNLVIEKALLELTKDDLENIDPLLADGGTLFFEYADNPVDLELATPRLKAPFSSLLGAVALTYNGNADWPLFPGTYAVTATIGEGKNHKAAEAALLLGYIRIYGDWAPPIIQRKVTLDVSPHFASDPAPGSFHVESGSNLKIRLTSLASLPEGYEPKVTTDRVDDKGGVKVTPNEDGTYTVRIAYIAQNMVVTVEAVAQPGAGDVGNEVASASDVIRVWSYGRQLYISAGANAGHGYVYDISGVLVKTIPFVSGETVSAVLPAGIYIVRAEGKVFKILIKT